MTLRELGEMVDELERAFGPDRSVLVADHQSWLTSATERIIGFYVYVPSQDEPVVLVYAGAGERRPHPSEDQTRG